MNRPRTYTIAAVLMVLYTLIGLPDTITSLSAGAAVAAANPNGPPYFITVINFILAILGFVSVYGVWRVQKWGVVLAIVVSALNVLTSLPAILFAAILPLRIIGAVSVIWAGAIIVLLLRPTKKPAVT